LKDESARFTPGGFFFARAIGGAKQSIPPFQAKKSTRPLGSLRAAGFFLLGYAGRRGRAVPVLTCRNLQGVAMSVAMGESLDVFALQQFALGYWYV
jgi:hypothetical protein